jgi:hypothetical protein
VQAWTRAARSSTALLPMQALAEAELEAVKHAELLSESELSLIAQSRLQQETDSRTKARRQKRFYALAWVTAIVGPALAAFALVSREFALDSQREAELAMKRAQASRQDAERASQESDAARLRALQAESSASAALTLEMRQSELLKAEREMAVSARAAAEAQARISERRLALIKKLLESIDDPALRSQLLAEYSRGVTPELTKAQAEQLEEKIKSASDAGLAGPRADAPPGFRLWRNGSTLRMRFIGGSSAQHALVLSATAEWARYANIHFVVSDSPDAELRIAFKPENGSWAYMGADSLALRNTEPTMNLGIPQAREVLHEFGHVLGLIHEHQNPNAVLPWNREAVYREMDYLPREQINRSILDKEKISGYREYDPNSIMFFAFDGKLFTDGLARGGKQVLSDSDKAFIAKLYPR